MYATAEEAAQAWADQNGWYAESTEDPDTDVAPLEFGYIVPAQGRQKEVRRRAMFGTWQSFAARLTSSKKIVETDEGWVIPTNGDDD